MNNNSNLINVKEDIRNKFMLPNVFSEMDYRKNPQEVINQNIYTNINAGKNEFKEKESSYNLANHFSNRVRF